MNKLEKDVLTLAMISSFVSNDLKSIIPEFDKSKIDALEPQMRFMESDKAAKQALVDLTKEVYSRIVKKTT